MPEDIILQILEWLEGEGDEFTYAGLQAYLPQGLTFSSANRVACIIALSIKHLGNQTSRAAWSEVQIQAHLLPNLSDKSLLTDILREFWFTCLLAPIRDALPYTNEVEVDNLIFKTDSLLDGYMASYWTQSACSAEPKLKEDVAKENFTSSTDPAVTPTRMGILLQSHCQEPSSTFHLSQKMLYEVTTALSSELAVKPTHSVIWLLPCSFGNNARHSLLHIPSLRDIMSPARRLCKTHSFQREHHRKLRPEIMHLCYARIPYSWIFILVYVKNAPPGLRLPHKPLPPHGRHQQMPDNLRDNSSLRTDAWLTFTWTSWTPSSNLKVTCTCSWLWNATIQLDTVSMRNVSEGGHRSLPNVDPCLLIFSHLGMNPTHQPKCEAVPTHLLQDAAPISHRILPR
ncbi:hypothetical protein SK128_026791 [Halocaridina rubra]|uniref:Uncharacterized protein n=1 Tax=Halocaridina rubra TaxID=373956 RepID=A0AAN8WQ07_HALRR